MSGHTSKPHAPRSEADVYRLAIHYQWHQDVDDRITAPDRSERWVAIDRWRDWVCWRRVGLEGAAP
jgi:hypothetical protein